MDRSLKGKSAVVTGGGSGGIGREIALALAAEGVSVVVNDIARTPDGTNIADQVVQEIEKAGGTAVANHDSVATMEGGQKIIRTAVASFGRIDILINCAGNFLHRSFVDMTESEWDSLNQVHLKGHFSCCKAAVPYMIKQKSGRIINMSSPAATGGGGNPAYATVKAGILGFTSALSMELHQYGITANALLPSADTKLFSGPRSIPGIPDPETLDPAYVVPIVLYLATDEAGNITNRFFYAAGGDIIIYAPLFQLTNSSHLFIRRPGKWTIGGLGDVLAGLKL
jgi:NAD(P)-dependent dehydrogenase (short-subunit alcohol dehydrogenase family)